ncbi:hypothetical protein HK098_005924 [Nowakowskiella sp. JEL0407]|nr:hypothetical protein HK098_005924 [Nowakowskiella sp. JEL0407]
MKPLTTHDPKISILCLASWLFLYIFFTSVSYLSPSTRLPTIFTVDDKVMNLIRARIELRTAGMEVGLHQVADCKFPPPMKRNAVFAGKRIVTELVMNDKEKLESWSEGVNVKMNSVVKKVGEIYRNMVYGRKEETVGDFENFKELDQMRKFM